MVDDRTLDKLEEGCAVCGEPLDVENVSTCRICGRRFHMAWSATRQTDTPACGRVQVDELSLGLVFMCDICCRERQLY